MTELIIKCGFDSWGRKVLVSGVAFWCPGCDEAHHVQVGLWTFNGDPDRPTLDPSILVRGSQWEPGHEFHKPRHARVPAGQQTVCHSFVRSGQIEFLSDCTHDMAGTTVPLPEWGIK